MIEIRHRSFEETLARAAELGGADLVLFSPPYPTVDPAGKGREGAPPRQYLGDASVHFMWEDYQRLGDLSFAALKPGGFCIVVVDGPVRFWRSKKIGSERSLIAFKLAVDWAERVGFRYVEHETYLRDGAVGDFHPRRRSGFEPVHVIQRPGARGYFDAWAASVPAKSAGLVKRNSAQRMHSGLVVPGRRVDTHVRPAKRTLTTAITAALGRTAIGIGDADREHPAPYTQYWAGVQVQAYSPPSGLVCDPFNGSGTTGIAAAKHGRSFVGGDLGARERDGRRWADIGQERAEQARDAAAGKTESHQTTSPQPSGQATLF